MDRKRNLRSSTALSVAGSRVARGAGLGDRPAGPCAGVRAHRSVVAPRTKTPARGHDNASDGVSRSARRRLAKDAVLRARVKHLLLPGMPLGELEAKRGETVTSFLRRSGWTFALPTICVRNGRPVMRAQWAKTRIRVGDRVEFWSRPGKGGGFGQIIGLVGLLALSILAPGIGTTIAGGLLGSTLAGTAILGTTYGAIAGGFIAAGIVAGGAILINSLVAPKQANPADNAAAQVYSVQASGNVARPLQSIKMNYGRIKHVPDFTTTAWSEFEGNDQYLNILLTLGLGSYAAETIYVGGDTVLWDSTNGVSDNFEGVQVEFYEPGVDVTLFPSNVFTATEVSGQELTDPNTDPNSGYIGGFAACPAGTTTKMIAIDVGFPGGIFYQDGQGNLGVNSCPLQAQYRPIDDAGAPTGDGSWTDLLNETVSLATRTPQRRTFKVAVTEGRYEVRLRTTITPANGTQSLGNTYYNICDWVGLRSYVVGPTSYPGVSTLALRIKATSQFSQTSLGQIAVLSTRKIPVWDSGTGSFSTIATRNPFWALLDAATNTDYGGARGIERVDFDTIVAEAADADTRGDTFDYEFASPQQISTVFDLILAPALSKSRWAGDILTSVRETNSTPRMLLTDREIVRDSVQIDYLLNDDVQADSVVIEYVDQETWQVAEVQYPPNSDSFTSVLPSRRRVDGVVNRDSAYKLAAHFYLIAQYRRINITLDTEHDGRLLGIGDRVGVQTELPITWGEAGRVVSVATRDLTVSPTPEWTDLPAQYYVSIRTKTGGQFGPVKCTKGGSDNIVSIDAADLGAVETAQGMTLAEALARSDGAEDPSFALGSSLVTCIVMSGEPNGENVTLHLALDDDRIYQVDAGTTPTPPTQSPLRDPRVPTILYFNAVIDQGIAEPILKANWLPAAGAARYVVQISTDDGASYDEIFNGPGTVISYPIDQPVSSVNVTVRVRPISADGLSGPWVSRTITPRVIAIQRGNLAQEIKDALDGVPIAINAAFNGPAVQQVRDISQAVANIASTIVLHRDDIENATENNKREVASHIGAVSASVVDEIAARTTADTALAASITELAATVGDNSADITAEAAARADADSALSDDITALTATVGTNTSAIATETTARADADNALSDSITALTATVGTNTSGLATEVSARASGDSANASSITALTSTVSGNTSSITTLTSTTADINGKLSATAGVQLDVNGHVSGILNYNDGTTSQFLIDADETVIDGSVTAAKMSVADLASVSSSTGALTVTDTITVSTNVVIDSNGLTVSD